MSKRSSPVACAIAALIALSACSADNGGEDKPPASQTTPAAGTAGATPLAGQGAPVGSVAGAAGSANSPGTTGGAGTGGVPASDAGPDAGVAQDAGHAAADAATHGPDAAAPADAATADAAPPPDSGTDAGAPDDGAGGRGAEPPFSPVYRIPLRVHRGDSALSEAALLEVLDEMNWIWWSQAAICFEVEIVDDDATMQAGYDFWFHKTSIPCSPGANGVYCGDHDIHTLDRPSLGSVDNAQWDTEHDPSRTSAHELGHGLTLEHYNGFADSNDSLMSSGRQGFKLHDTEIDAARTRARSKGLQDTVALYCSAPKSAPR